MNSQPPFTELRGKNVLARTLFFVTGYVSDSLCIPDPVNFLVLASSVKKIPPFTTFSSTE